MKLRIAVGFATAFAFLVPASLSAHHGSANYDTSKSASIKGTVKQFAFTNPHSAIYVDVKNDTGNAEEWLVEADSPNNLARNGGPATRSRPATSSPSLGTSSKMA